MNRAVASNSEYCHSRINTSLFPAEDVVNIGRLLSRHAKFRRHHPALVFGDQRLTLGSLNSRANQLANGFLRTATGKVRKRTLRDETKQ